MTRSSLRASGVALVLGLALVAGCSGGSTLGAPPGVPAPLVLRAAGSGDLLYVGEAIYQKSVIAVFSYPGGQAVGTLSGVSEPRGLCSDARGNVFVTSYQSEQVVKYRHGGTKPAATLTLFSHAPLGCAIDPTTNTLAVTTDNGDVALFKNESGQASYVNYSAMTESAFCTYDGSGDLFADGYDVSGAFVLAELPSGSSTMKGIAVEQVVSPGLAVQWDGKYLALQTAQDFHKAVVDRFSVSGSSATLVGKTVLRASPDNSPAQFWIANATLFAAFADNESVGAWRYPAGGNPTQTITDSASDIVGITLSVKGK